MRFHNPIFPEDSALFIIWAEDRWSRFSLAAGSLVAMNAAWAALQSECPRAELTLQDGARVLQRRGPLNKPGG